MKISLISSLYRTDKHIENWQKKLEEFAAKAAQKNIDFEIVAVSNDPTEIETKVLDVLVQKPWFKLVIVERESIYASWNRGINNASGEICGFWNVDDIRFIEAIEEGLKVFGADSSSSNTTIDASAETANTDQKPCIDIVYFPFIYKRYINILGIKVLVKRKLIVPPEFEKNEFIRSMHSGPFFIFRKSSYEKVGPFDPLSRVVGDYEWCARASSMGFTFKHVPVSAGLFANDGTTLSGSKSLTHTKELVEVFKKYDVKDKLEQFEKILAEKTAAQEKGK